MTQPETTAGSKPGTDDVASNGDKPSDDAETYPDGTPVYQGDDEGQFYVTAVFPDQDGYSERIEDWQFNEHGALVYWKVDGSRGILGPSTHWFITEELPVDAIDDRVGATIEFEEGGG